MNEMFREKIKCIHCGCEIEEGAELYSKEGAICEDCASEYYAYCEVCEQYESIDQVYEIKTGYRTSKIVCESCLEENDDFFYCEDCEEWKSTDWYDKYTTANGRTICYGCYDDNYVTCYECGEIIHVDDARYDDDEEEYYCEQCWQARSSRRINGYSFKPDPIFKTRHDTFYTSRDIKELMFGVENEIDKGNDPYDTAANICDASEDVYIKHDGSLTEDGMEIVTHPCSLEYHIENLGWKDICNVALESHYKSHDAGTCGLHIHVGRYQLGENREERDETIAKIIVLIDRHWNNMVRFSRRKRTQLVDWAAAPNLCITSGELTKEEIYDKAWSTEHRGRYQAVNLTNSETIEFRLFNGTLKYQTIIATLQMVSNICTFAKEYSLETVLASSWSDICNIKKYAELQVYLKSRGLNDVPFLQPTALKNPFMKTPMFAEGDIVMLKNNNGQSRDYANALIKGLGKIGRITKVYKGAIVEYIVSFTENFSDCYMFRDNGSDNCLWVKAENVERVYSKAEIDSMAFA